MSKSLKERLKKSSRYSMSPLLPKRQCGGISSLFTPVKTDGHVINQQSKNILPDENSGGSDECSIKSSCVSLEKSLEEASDCPVLKPSQLKNCHSDSTNTLTVTQTPESANGSNDAKTDNIVTPQEFEKSSEEDLKKAKLRWQSLVHAKEEKLRKLKLVKMYRLKNNLEELQSLINKWRTVSQEALTHLVDINTEHNVSLLDLVNYFSLDHKLLGFDAEDESFTSV